MSTTPDQLLLQRISAERLSGYLAATDGDLGRAIRLYEWNVKVAAAFFETLCDVEVVVRNAIHDQLAEWNSAQGYGGEWYDNRHGFLLDRAMEEIDKARDRVARGNKPISPGRVVAELNFGFWRFLLTNRYKTTLWPFALKSAFPNVSSHAVDKLFQRVGRLHDLRNRVAHHEPIHSRRLEFDLQDCLMTVRGVCLDTEQWTQQRSRVSSLLAMRPNPAVNR